MNLIVLSMGGTFGRGKLSRMIELLTGFSLGVAIFTTRRSVDLVVTTKTF
jgi:hypothetical protein